VLYELVKYNHREYSKVPMFLLHQIQTNNKEVSGVGSVRVAQE
jgi:hypothetical protein